MKESQFLSIGYNPCSCSFPCPTQKKVSVCFNNCLNYLHPLFFNECLSVLLLCLYQILCSRGVNWLLTEDLISWIFLGAIACSQGNCIHIPFPPGNFNRRCLSLSLSLTWSSEQLRGPLRPNTSHLPTLLHSTSWSADTHSTLPALLGSLQQKSSRKLLGSWLGWESEPEDSHPFLCKKPGALWN